MHPLPRPNRTHTRAWAVLGAMLALLAIAGAGLVAREAQGAPSQKNVVFILTDDMTFSELSVMPNVQSLLADQGTSFNEAYISFPLCCPSRATFLTGQYMHNHGVHGNYPPYGSWSSFIPDQANDLAVRMQKAGYYNVHIGKYLNGYTSQDGTLPVPPGWDEWYGKVSEDALYFNYQLIEKTGPTATPHITFYGDQPDDYQTTVFNNRALNFIGHNGLANQPFWLNLWFNSPHGPFDPAPSDLGSLAGTPLPKLLGFNEKNITDKPKWLQRQVGRRLSKRQAKLIANERRHQEEQLLSVDRGVGDIVQELKTEGILNNTYIIFASDNGIFRGEHRIGSGKFLPYDPAARVPLIIRGPGIPAGGVSDELVWNGDVPQTMLQIGTGSQDNSLDGRSLLPFAENPSLRSTRPILLEGDTGPGNANAESAKASASRAREARVGLADRRGVKNLEQEPDAIKSAANSNKAPAFRSIRTARYEYTIYANGQSELYDMLHDPAQLHSVVKDPRYADVRRWLYDRLIPLSTCDGPACRVELGPDPLPLTKAQLRKRNKKRKQKGKGPGTGAKHPAPKH
jgi:N-acetylglucosamine-6-sulfatase